MLQLTQTDNGQITGVFSAVDVNAQGRVNSGQGSVEGAVDNAQLTLKVHVFLFGDSLAGTVRRNTIQLQTLESNGEVRSMTFKRGSQSDFKKYADELKLKGGGIELSGVLLRRAQQFRAAIQSAERWISDAELHVQRIPGVKDRYRKIEDQMRFLVERERAAPNSVARGQLSVDVSQGNIAGTQTDIQVNQTWDFTVGDVGRSLRRTFASFPANCGASSELKKRGASPESIAAWKGACEQVISERTKFEVALNRIMAERAELKSYQTTAESRRQALVAEAGRIQ
jgi:hypothetical protein